MNSADVKVRLSPAYWRLWTASTISNLGDGVFLVALPLLAYHLTRSELSIAFIGVAAALPWLLFSLPIGALVDRIDHRLLMVRADAFRVLTVGALAIAVASHNVHIWMLWVAAGCLGVAEVFSTTPRRRWCRRSCRSRSSKKRTVVVGSRGCGQQLRRYTDRKRAVRRRDVAALRVRCSDFAIAAALVYTLRVATKPRPPTAVPHRRLRTDIAEGLHWLSRHRVLRGVAVAASLAVLGMQMTAAIFVLFAHDLLHLSDRWYGALIAIGAVGAVIGGLVAERLSKRMGALSIIYGTVVLWTLCMFAEGFWPRLWVSATATVVMAFGTTVWNTVTISLRQRIVPPHLLGRVNSVYRWLVWGSISVGSALGGIIAREFGLRAPFFFGAAFGAVALVTMFFSITARDISALTRQPLVPTATHSTDETPVHVDTFPWPGQLP